MFETPVFGTETTEKVLLDFSLDLLPFVFAYYKLSKTEQREGLGMRLFLPHICLPKDIIKGKTQSMRLINSITCSTHLIVHCILCICLSALGGKNQANIPSFSAHEFIPISSIGCSQSPIVTPFAKVCVLFMGVTEKLCHTC